jgi:hypothetical protein
MSKCDIVRQCNLLHDDTLKGVSDLKAENKFMATKIEPLPDDTGEKQGNRFVKGQSGNPKGRPKGARSRLGEKFLDNLYDEWEKSGQKALAICAAREPTQFIKVVANVLPRELLVKALNVNATMDFTDVEDARAFLKAYRYVRDAQPEPLELEHAADGALVAPGWRSAND